MLNSVSNEHSDSHLPIISVRGWQRLLRVLEEPMLHTEYESKNKQIIVNYKGSLERRKERWKGRKKEC